MEGQPQSAIGEDRNTRITVTLNEEFTEGFKATVKIMTGSEEVQEIYHQIREQHEFQLMQKALCMQFSFVPLDMGLKAAQMRINTLISGLKHDERKLSCIIKDKHVIIGYQHLLDYSNDEGYILEHMEGIFNCSAGLEFEMKTQVNCTEFFSSKQSALGLLAKGAKATLKITNPKRAFKKINDAIQNVCGKEGNHFFRNISLLTFLKAEGDMHISIDEDLFEQLKKEEGELKELNISPKEIIMNRRYNYNYEFNEIMKEHNLSSLFGHEDKHVESMVKLQQFIKSQIGTEAQCIVCLPSIGIQVSLSGEGLDLFMEAFYRFTYH